MKEPWKGYYKDVESKTPPRETLLLIKRVRRNIRSRNPVALDFGCGNGIFTCALASSGFNTYGFDISREALLSARSMLKSSGLSAKLVIHDAGSRLPYKSRFFDFAFARRAGYHTTMPHIKEIMKEIMRVLKPGGFVFFSGGTIYQYLSYKRRGQKLKRLEKGTYISLSGDFKGVTHHYFTEKELRFLFEGEAKPIYLHMQGRFFHVLYRKTAIGTRSASGIRRAATSLS